MPNIPPDIDYNVKIFAESVTFGKAPTLPSGSIPAAAIASAANVEYSKLANARTATRELYPETTTVVALASQLIHTVRGTSGTLIGMDGFICSTLSTTDNTVTVDLQATTAGSSSWATVCTTPLTFLSTG